MLGLLNTYSQCDSCGAVGLGADRLKPAHAYEANALAGSNADPVDLLAVPPMHVTSAVMINTSLSQSF
jgi:hypothetical protein